jgi:1-acyl-sn-glycerol-3-phosphate acyltransferase
MKTFSGKVLKLLGWKIVGEYPDIKKSIAIFAPHTSYWDGFYGKLLTMHFGIKYKFLFINSL